MNKQKTITEVFYDSLEKAHILKIRCKAKNLPEIWHEAITLLEMRYIRNQLIVPKQHANSSVKKENSQAERELNVQETKSNTINGEQSSSHNPLNKHGDHSTI